MKKNSIPNKSRRKAVKNIVCGVSALAAYNALPAKWGTPILEQVFLPAHAQTSVAINGNFQGNVVVNVAVTAVERNFGEFVADVGDTIADFLVPSAHAQETAQSVVFSCCATLADDNATFIGVDIFSGAGCVEASGSVSATASVTTSGGAAYVFQILSTTTDTITVQIDVTYLETHYTGKATLARITEACKCVAVVPG